MLAEFGGLHGGTTTLAAGPGGRGFVGPFDVTTTTDANGTFVIQAPPLPEGFQTVRVVVIGQPDIPPQAGLSSSFDHAFRIDNTPPQILQVTQTPAAGATTNPAAIPLTGTNLSSLSSLSLDVLDPSNPTTGPLATPAQLLVPALDPATADNVGNYTLFNLDTNADESPFIASATFVATAPDFITTPASRANAAAPNAGRIDLTFAPGLPAGHYILTAHTAETVPVVSGGAAVAFQGLRDAAGNPLNNTSATGAADFSLNFTLQPQPVYITSLNLENSAGAVIGGPRSYFELPPSTGTNTRDNVAAPPTTFVLDFSNPLTRDGQLRQRGPAHPLGQQRHRRGRRRLRHARRGGPRQQRDRLHARPGDGHAGRRVRHRGRRGQLRRGHGQDPGPPARAGDRPARRRLPDLHAQLRHAPR